MKRTPYAIGLLLCLCALSVALGLEHLGGLDPCPLCILSRVMVFALVPLFVLGLCLNPKIKGRYLLAGVGVFTTLIGVGLNVRHLYLQSLPKELAPACGPSLDYLIQVLTPFEVLTTILQGSGECAQVQWTFLGLSLPAWTLAFFLMILITWIWVLRGEKKG